MSRKAREEKGFLVRDLGCNKKFFIADLGHMRSFWRVIWSGNFVKNKTYVRIKEVILSNIRHNSTRIL